uniref:Pentatricopeptide repeat-containing protein n=2 Tax=Kalmanozyma brasiliensis (strain GHG001) TaxID=1365824 RepID=V5GL05_KALBG
MFQDMSQLFGFRVGPTDLHRQLQTYCLAKSPLYDPVQGFERLRAGHPEWQTTSVDWSMIISYLARREQYDRAVTVWNDMLEYGVRPETSLRSTMVQVYLAAEKPAEAIVQVQELAREEPKLGIDTLTTTVEGLCRLAENRKLDNNLTNELDTLSSHLRKALDSSRQAGTDSSAWQALLHCEAIVNGPAHALQTAKKACKPGLLGSSAVCMLLRLHVDELNDLQSSDEALELLDRVQTAADPKRTIKVDDNAYSTLMLGLLNKSEAQGDTHLLSSDDGNGGTLEQLRAPPSPNQIHEAQNLYNHVRALGVAATPLLVKPLLTAYCDAFLPSLPSAMKLVRDMLDHRSSSTSVSRRSKDARASTIEMTTMQPVLDACIKLKDLSSARDLLSRLYDAKIPIHAKDKAHLIRRLITIATSWPEAFTIYRSLMRFPSPTGARGLDFHGYHSVLSTFTTLSFPSYPAAPPEDLLSILVDMRSTTTPPTCSTYTLLLDYYAKLAIPSYLGVHLTHEHLKRDTSLEPDLPLINALMNAYNWVGEPAMVVAIWDNLLATRQGVDGVTLSVVFDTAGRHGLLSLARRAVRDGKGVMSKGAWDSWLECLARCGRLEEAVEVAFGEMRRTLLREAMEKGTLPDQDGGLTVNELLMRSSQAAVRDRQGQVVGPDAKTLSTLLKFAARERDRRKRQAGMPLLTGPTTAASTARSKGTSIWHTLRARIREDFSWLYPQVKHIGEDTPV